MASGRNRTATVRGSQATIERDICSGGEGAKGITYDEASLFHSLLWNLPFPYPVSTPRRLRSTSGGMRRGARTRAISASLPLPLFYSDSPGEEWWEELEEGVGEENDGLGVEGEERASEIREVSPDIVHRVQPWARRSERVVHFLPLFQDSDTASRVRSSLGYEFPPVMGKLLERRVQEQWRTWKKQGIVPTGDPAEVKRLYNSLVVDSQVFLAKQIEKKLISERDMSRATSGDYSAIKQVHLHPFLSASPGNHEGRNRQERRTSKRPRDDDVVSSNRKKCLEEPLTPPLSSRLRKIVGREVALSLSDISVKEEEEEEEEEMDTAEEEMETEEEDEEKHDWQPPVRRKRAIARR